MGLIAHAIPPASKADLTRRILAAQEIVLKSGLTGVHDAGLHLAHAGIEQRKQPCRAGANDRNVADVVDHRLTFAAPVRRFNSR